MNETVIAIGVAILLVVAVAAWFKKSGKGDNAAAPKGPAKGKPLDAE